MRNEICCFSGHRKIPLDQYDIIADRLKKEIIILIDKGVRYFGAGGAWGFDTMAAETVLKLREDYPQIKLILVLPCKNQAEKWKPRDVLIYNKIKRRCDKIVYISDNYTEGCMLKRNRHLVDNSDYCVCYLTSSVGGTAYTVRYAEKKKLKIINLAKPTV